MVERGLYKGAQGKRRGNLSPYPEQRDGADDALVLRRGERGVGGLEDLCRFGVGGGALRGGGGGGGDGGRGLALGWHFCVLAGVENGDGLMVNGLKMR